MTRSPRWAPRSSRRRSASGRPKAASPTSIAHQAAARRRTSATQAQQAAIGGQRAASAVNTRADAIEAASRKLLFEVVLSEDQGKFKFGKTELPDEAKSAIDQMVNGIKSQKSSVWIEIEGHTDNVGDQDVQRTARAGARRSREALSLRAAPGAAPQDERDQLRRRQAGDRQPHPRRAAPRTAASSSRCSRNGIAIDRSGASRLRHS